jgi:hypothetical protein
MKRDIPGYEEGIVYGIDLYLLNQEGLDIKSINFLKGQIDIP